MLLFWFVVGVVIAVIADYQCVAVVCCGWFFSDVAGVVVVVVIAAAVFVGYVFQCYRVVVLMPIDAAAGSTETQARVIHSERMMRWKIPF